MQQNLTGWLDYDRSTLPQLLPLDRVEYFERRVRRLAINPLGRIVDNEIQVAPDSSALLVFGVSICCAIEACGKFLLGGRGGNAARFQGFLDRYMASEFQSRRLGSDTYGECLWRHFRNGLAHGFAVRHGGFERNRGQAYFVTKRIANHETLSVNPYLLYDDFSAGFGTYVAELRKAVPRGTVFRDFDHVFETVFIEGK